MTVREVALTAVVAMAILGIVAGSLFGGFESGDSLWPLSWLPWAPVGYLILIKRPGNRVGLAVLSIGVLWGASFGSLALAVSWLNGPAAAWAELANVLSGVGPWFGIMWLLLIFPTGRLAGPLERATAIGLFGFASMALASFALSPSPMIATDLPSPLAVPALSRLTAVITEDQGFIGVIALVALSIGAVIRRWRRSDGLERAQYRWLFLGACTFLVVLLVGQFVSRNEGGSSADYLWLVAAGSIPVSIAFAITRYRLYDIDRIISRTLSYALVVGLLASIFAAGAVWLPTRLGGGGSDLFVAGSTLAVAALFNPVRRRVQSLVDRRFNRSRYDAEDVVETFAGALRDQVDPDEVIGAWTGVVTVTMQPSTTGVWVRSP